MHYVALHTFVYSYIYVQDIHIIYDGTDPTLQSVHGGPGAWNPVRRASAPAIGPLVAPMAPVAPVAAPLAVPAMAGAPRGLGKMLGGKFEQPIFEQMMVDDG